MKSWLEALRATHWIKSGFCLAALFFHGDALKIGSWLQLIPLLVGFSLAASSGYLLNDLINMDEDARHPRKRSRPVTSGRLSRGAAWAGMWVLLGVSLLVTVLAYGWGAVVLVLGGYVVVTFSYSLVFRRIPVVDVLVLGIGFVARVLAGAFALGVVPTVWLVICTYALALLLGFGKRKGEWRCMETHHQEVGGTRKALQGYRRSLLDSLTGFCAVLVGVTYLMYCLQRPDRMPFLLTIVPVTAGLMSYLRMAWRSEMVEAPERLLLRSPVLIGAVVSWAAMVVWFV